MRPKRAAWLEASEKETNGHLHTGEPGLPEEMRLRRGRASPAEPKHSSALQTISPSLLLEALQEM